MGGICVGLFVGCLLDCCILSMIVQYYAGSLLEISV